MMHKLYGTDGVQESPPPSSFPLLGLESKSVVLLDEWRFNEKILSLATQLLWYEGKPLPVARPQNQAGVAGLAVPGDSAHLRDHQVCRPGADPARGGLGTTAWCTFGAHHVAQAAEGVHASSGDTDARRHRHP